MLEFMKKHPEMSFCQNSVQLVYLEYQGNIQPCNYDIKHKLYEIVPRENEDYFGWSLKFKPRKSIFVLHMSYQ